MSVAFALFLTATSVRPRVHPAPWAPMSLYVPLIISMTTIYLIPQSISTKDDDSNFLTLVLVMHAMLFIPFLSWYTEGDGRSARRLDDMSFSTLYTILIALAVIIHTINTGTVYASLPSTVKMGSYLYARVFSHPAQSSISLDVIWVGVTLTCWWLMTGGFITVVAKCTLLASGLAVAVARYTGVDWSLVLSAFPILALLAFGVMMLGINRIRKRNVTRRRELLDKMGISDGQVVPGTDKKPPSKSSIKTLVGFFHPYWYVSLIPTGDVVLIKVVTREEVEREYSGQRSPIFKHLSQTSFRWCILVTARPRIQRTIRPKSSRMSRSASRIHV